MTDETYIRQWVDVGGVLFADIGFEPDETYIRQWVDVGGVLFADIGFEPDETEIKEEDSDYLDLSIFCFHAGWFDALFWKDLPQKIDCNFIFDYLCCWYSQKHELEIAFKHCHWEEF